MVAIVAFAEDYLGTNGFNRNRGEEEEARHSHGRVDGFAFKTVILFVVEQNTEDAVNCYVV
jgi:hypothetical protein